MHVVAALVLLIVTLILAVPSAWYAVKIHRLAGGTFLAEGEQFVDLCSAAFALWTLAMLGLVGLSFRRKIEPRWLVLVTVLTVLVAGAHLELVHSRVHVACVLQHELGITLNCAPWLPAE